MLADDMGSILLKVRRYQPNRIQRLILFVSATLWFMAFVLSHQRNFQDSWILEGVFWPFIGFIVLFLLVLSKENDNRVVAILCSLTVFVLALVPALKYSQPYGIAIDATEHFLMVSGLLNEGLIQQNHVYSSMPGMHAWLASLALAGGFSSNVVMKFGPPLLGAIIPLITYWICKRANISSNITKYILAATCLAIYPYYLPTGTSFALAPMLLLLGTLLLREYYITKNSTKVLYTLIASIILIQIIIWHGITSMILPMILASVSLTPIFVSILRQSQKTFKPARDLLLFALLSALLFIVYHVIIDDQFFKVVQTIVSQLITTKETTAAALPERVFEISLIDLLQVALVMHGRDFLLFALTGLSLVVILHFRKQWTNWHYLFVFLFLFLVTFGALMASVFAGADYDRFIIATYIVLPFFVGVALWWIGIRVANRRKSLQLINRLFWLLLVFLLVGATMLQFYIYQPLVPKVSATISQEEYVVWLHTVNSAYQQKMLNFAETNSDLETHFAIDIEGISQYLRYFGRVAASRRGLDSPLHWNKPIDDNVKLFLLHWPGPAGALGEQIENRSETKITELRQTPGWGLIYDNGESFIMTVR